MHSRHQFFKRYFSSKRAQLALRFFTYGVMAISTVVLTTLAIFYAMGYHFNHNSLDIEQGGILEFRSKPDGASIYIDGKAISPRTPGRQYVSAGTHTVEMRLDRYQSWHRTVDVAPGQLLWLDYIRFVPQTVTTSAIKAFGTMTRAVASPDRAWLLLQEKVDSASFTLADVSNPEKPIFSTLAIPEAQLQKQAGATGSFRIVEWDPGSRAVLVWHDIGDVHELLYIDRTKPNEAVNLSKLFGLAIGEVHFAGDNQNVLYAQIEGALRRLDIGAATVSAALVNGLQQFGVYDGRVAFVAQQESTNSDMLGSQLVVGLYQNGKQTAVRHYPLGTTLRIALSEYFRHQYLAVNQGDNVVEVLRDPIDKALETPVFIRFELDRPVQWLNFNANGRMLAAGGGNMWATHDFEVSQTYHSHLDAPESTASLQWLDDFYLWTDVGDRLRIVEFDGQNPRDITSLTTGYTAALSQNGKSLFTFNKGVAGVLLQESRLVNQ